MQQTFGTMVGTTQSGPPPNGATTPGEGPRDLYGGPLVVHDTPEAPRRRKRAIPQASRRALADRWGADEPRMSAAAFCAYCGAAGSVYRHSWGWATFTDLEIDHIIPEYFGGPSTPWNLTLACRRCNRGKRTRLWEPLS